jgi:uncharacterized protein YecT (DUF1311 family)
MRTPPGLLLLLLCCLGPMSAPRIEAASFDCRKAASTVEKQICADPAASRLDEELAREYLATSRGSEAGGALKAAQLAWLKHTRNACVDAACLREAYEARIDALRGGSSVFPDAKAAIKGSCAALAQAAAARPGDCRVLESGSFGRVDGAEQMYASYCLDAPAEEGRSCDLTAIALFRIDPGTGQAQRWLQRADSEGMGNHFGKPELVRLKESLLLDLPVSVHGTGAFNASMLYRRDGSRWVAVDITSWEKDLAARLPRGLAVWKGIWPDYRTMSATTGLYRSKDANCCATGGSAEVKLRLERDRLVIAELEIGPPPR